MDPRYEQALVLNRTATFFCIAFALTACGGGGDPAPPAANHSPVVAAGIDDQFAIIGAPFDLDVSRGGRFSDPDGDPLTYELTLEGVAPGLSVAGARISGTPSAPAIIGVTVKAVDSRGAFVSERFRLELRDNTAPQVSRANRNVIVSAHAGLDYDATQGGATFVDAEGQPLTYQLTILQAPAGFSVQGTRLLGTLSGPGYLKAKIEARDPFGAAAADYFALVVPEQVSSRPTLPAQSYVYEDAQLPLPSLFSLFQNKLHWDDTTPNDNPISNAGATLGRVLFYDKRLSVTNTHACGSCHQQAHGFANAERFPHGALGAPTRRSPMALANVRFNNDDRYFSDERAGRLESLALMPIQDAEELGSPLPALAQELADTDYYPPLFAAAFGTPEVSSERIARALAQFLRSLISYRSKFDRANYSVLPEPAPDPALVFTAQEQRGAAVFLDSKCFFCHESGGFEMPWPANNGLDEVFTDPGVTGGRFRAGSLRNVAVSAPYMHDGRFATLREVIDHYDSGVMASADLDIILGVNEPRRLNLTEEDKQALEAFLNTLTDSAFLSDPKFADPFQ
jgi:cytochrome c peroxidase